MRGRRGRAVGMVAGLALCVAGCARGEDEAVAAPTPAASPAPAEPREAPPSDPAPPDEGRQSTDRNGNDIGTAEPR